MGQPASPGVLESVEVAEEAQQVEVKDTKYRGCASRRNPQLSASGCAA